MEKKEFELIITIVNRGFADLVMDAAKAAGAHGGTVLYGRGAGIHEAEKFFGVSIEPEKEVVLVLLPKQDKDAVMRAITKGAGLNSEGKGLTFSLPVDDVLGIVHMTKQE
ncbi:MAG: P-II family nitrogen regulator [Clostridia bacterium]|jgi:nitrogen regulatory protein PII|nr:P-II family nitrogen regulator [Clostridia bacterium]